MRRDIGCAKVDHWLSRRSLLAGAAAGTSLAAGLTPVQAEQLRSGQKRVLQVYLQGGVSQFESWDPKPGTKFGGPFRSIETSVPGVRICELLPHTAQRMHLLSVVRSINLKTNDHGVGRVFMEKGRKNGAFPYIGSVAAKYLAPANPPLPGYLHITTRGLNDNTAAFLGAKYAQLKLPGADAPENLERPKQLTDEGAVRREELRQRLSQRFAGGRGQPAETEAYESSYEMAERLLAQKAMFKAEPSPAELERYGSHPFARNCILARNLLMNGGTCVKVTHHGYDTHAENFNFHLEQLGEFDKTFCMLLDDLHHAGMLDSTLVMIYSEFGRTPKINQRYGRDHWGASVSVAVGGAGIQPGVVVGATNDEGTEVADREVDAGHLFHTYFQAVGIDSSADHEIAGKSIPIGDPVAAPIEEILA
ncbi:MAG: DUF1501 domain-containing protein [Planctomycetota bacterium]|nr:MAG: DUF1501 domain-containing protein [Planctomycetota bacterium]